MITNRAGQLLRQWRKRRNLSQLELAVRSKTSQRHLSFVESGRSQANRALILSLSEALDIPLRARNEILLRSGFAPAFPERSLQATEMKAASGILKRMMEHHDPYPAMVLDGAWNLVMHNQAAAFILRSCAGDAAIARYSVDGRVNFARLLCAEDGMRPHIRSWQKTGRVLLHRLRREAAAYPGSRSQVLLDDLLMSKAFPEFEDLGDEPNPAAIPMEIDVDGFTLKLLTTVTTFGTPLDVSLQEIHIEMSYPADEATDHHLRVELRRNLPS